MAIKWIIVTTRLGESVFISAKLKYQIIQNKKAGKNCNLLKSEPLDTKFQQGFFFVYNII